MEPRVLVEILVSALGSRRGAGAGAAAQYLGTIGTGSRNQADPKLGRATAMAVRGPG